MAKSMAISMTFTAPIRKMAAALAGLLIGGVLLSTNLAMAQAEPTLNEVYAAARAGKLAEAQTMVQQVLVYHPKSGKARFVQAELFARQGNLDSARASLATAEELAPGLKFEKPEAVQALRTQLSQAAPATGVKTGSGLNSRDTARDTSREASLSGAAQPSALNTWVMPLLLAGGVVAAGYFIFRRKVPTAVAQQPVGGTWNGPAPGSNSDSNSNLNSSSNGLSGNQTFGMANTGTGAAPPSYPPSQQPPMQPAGYAPTQPAPAQPGTGMGGRIMGGVATGLAVGAGVMAAEAIGRNLMGNHDRNANAQDAGRSNHLYDNDSPNTASSSYAPQVASSNPDMGGNDFGVRDASTWDDAGSADSGGGGGGGDWDN